MPGLGQTVPESPQVVAGLLVRFGACNRMDRVSARIERAGDALDVAALAGCVPALIGNDDRDFFAVQLVVQVMKLCLQLVKTLLVLLVGEALVEGDLG